MQLQFSLKAVDRVPLLVVVWLRTVQYFIERFFLLVDDVQILLSLLYSIAIIFPLVADAKL